MCGVTAKFRVSIMETGSWMVIYQFAAEELAKEKRMGGAEFRVLHMLLGMMGKDSSVQISQADIGKMMGMQQQGVSKAIKTLIEIGIIRSEGKTGQTATYTLNSYYGKSGNASNVVQMQRKWDSDQ
jgi:biotin operon repressor